jgi:hypothetical protein
VYFYINKEQIVNKISKQHAIYDRQKHVTHIYIPNKIKSRCTQYQWIIQNIAEIVKRKFSVRTKCTLNL